MNEYSQRNYLEELLHALCQAKVDFVVAGGVAGVLHGIERTTMDLDIALDLSIENVKRFSSVVEELNLQALVPVPIEALADPESVRLMVENKQAIVYMLADPQMPLRKIDVFLTEDLSYRCLRENCQQVDLEPYSIQVVSLQKLLELKKMIQPPRDKDIFDIHAIESLMQEGAGNDSK